MQKRRFREEQIIGILQEVEAGFETHPAHSVEALYYLGFRLFGVGAVGAKMGLWYPKWDPKNSGCLAGTQRISVHRKGTRSPNVTSVCPEITNTYCRPSTMYVIGAITI